MPRQGRGSMTRTDSNSAIAVDTAWSLAAEGSRLLSSLVSFLLVARTLGPTDYGVLAGATALVTMIGLFAHLGGPVLIVQRVRHHDWPLADAYRLAMAMALSGAALGTGAVLLLGNWLLSNAPVEAILALALGEYVFGAVVQCCSFAAISNDDYAFTPSWCSASAVRVSLRLACLST
jgi:O-antigen/teichoic acid export membrane protein